MTVDTTGQTALNIVIGRIVEDVNEGSSVTLSATATPNLLTTNLTLLREALTAVVTQVEALRAGGETITATFTRNP